MSVLIYNDIIFEDIKTKTLSQKPIFTDDKVDYLYTEVTIGITAIWSAYTSSLLESDLTSIANEYTHAIKKTSSTELQDFNRDILFPAAKSAGRLGKFTPQEKMRVLRESLMVPRRRLYFNTSTTKFGTGYETEDIFGSEPIITVYPVSDYVSPEDEGNLDLEEADEVHKVYDAKFGPEPQKLDVVEIIGSESFLVEYEIKTYIVDEFYFTDEVNQSRKLGDRADLTKVNNRLLSNRWNEKCSVDVDGYSTIIRSGIVKLRSGPDGCETDGFILRSLIVPPLRKGFRREAMEFSLDNSGLELQYTISDRQIWLHPREPLVRTISGTCSVSSPLSGIRAIEVNVSVTGEMPKFDGYEEVEEADNTRANEFTVDSQRGQQIILNYAMWIALSKITMGRGRFFNPANSNDPNEAKYPILESVVIKQGMFENKVDVTIKAKQANTTDLNYNPLRTPTGYNENETNLVLENSPKTPEVMGTALFYGSGDGPQIKVFSNTIIPTPLVHAVANIIHNRSEDTDEEFLEPSSQFMSLTQQDVDDALKVEEKTDEQEGEEPLEDPEDGQDWINETGLEEEGNF